MARCLIALGGNIEVSESVFESAIKQLRRPGIEVIRLSNAVKTRPTGSSAGEEFLNAAAILECSLEPFQLLNSLHEVENAFGRTRAVHWGPRTLDLDLCLFHEQVVDGVRICVPHPAMWYRRFVLDPAVEVAAGMIHPVLKQSIRELHSQVHSRPIRVALRCADDCSKLLNLHNAVQTVQNSGDGWEWIYTKESPQDADFSGYFAEIVVERRPVLPQSRTQPHQEAGRTIRVHADSESDLADQLHALQAAILG